MGSLGSENDEIKPVKENSGPEDGDTQRMEFDSQFSPFSGEENDHILYGLQCLEKFRPLDTILTNDAFETQRMDFDSETQPLNLTEETQVGDLGEGIQLLDDEGDCSGSLETQLLCEFNEEGVGGSDEEDTVGTKVLMDTEVLADTESFRRDSDKALGNKEKHSTSLCSQDEADSKSIGSLHSADVACSSGSVRWGFTSIRTASLRNLGLSARKKMALKGAESGDVPYPNEVKASDLRDGAVDQELDMGKPNDGAEGLSYESNTKFGCSAARQLFLDNIDIDEHECNDKTGDNAEGEDFGQVPICANDLAGLSYVNSQEPGESSQANALDFVEQFLKVNVCDFGLDRRQLNIACEKPNPAPSAKGTQKLARKVNVRCSLAETGVYDWDDNREDEGGGEFLTRNKEVFFGNSSGSWKSLTEPQKPKQHRQMRTGTHKKSMTTEHQLITVDDKRMSSPHSEPKLNASRKMDQHEKMNIQRNLESDFKKQFCADPTIMQVETEAYDAEKCKMLDIGFDTQMAAEAMELLSNEVALASDGEIAFQGEDCGVHLKDKVTKRSVVKQNSTQKRVRPAELGVTTRSKQIKRTRNQAGDESKSFVAFQACFQNARKQVVKGKATSRVQNTVNITNLNMKRKPGKRAFRANGKVKEGYQHRNLDDNESVLAKKQWIEEKIDTVAPIASRTRKNMLAAVVNTANIASESSDYRKTEAENLRVVDTYGKRRKVNDGWADAKEKASELIIMGDGIHSRDLTCSKGNARDSSVQLSGKAESKDSLEESARHDKSITRRRRSNRRLLSQKQFQSILSSDENDVCCSPLAEKAQAECCTQGTHKEMAKSSLLACTTPVNCRTSVNTASPVCIGDEYYKLSCKKNLKRSSLMKELNSLTPSGPKCTLSVKGLRKRRDMGSIKVLFSHHLHEDIIRQQKKLLARLGVPTVSSIIDATHFVTDEFVRTRNMLEAIAHGKPVVNHLWLESCGQAGCYIDEKNYILRDAKKEKDLGFSMPVSLARASQHPLLKGRRVLMTPNTKPGVEILSSLVKAVHGQAFERICKSLYKDDKLRNDLLILSCEEDYEFCVPLLEKGAEIYSSELLLNGIIIQKLECQRHRLFLDHVKRTRSTIWLKKNGKEFHPVKRRE